MQKPPFIPFPLLSDERIALIELTTEYVKEAMELLKDDKKRGHTLEDALDLIMQVHESYHCGESINWLILDKKNRKVAGTCGFNRGFENGSGEIGFVLLPAFRGKGYMSAAIKLVIRFGLEEMELSNIRAVTEASNDPCIKLLESNSFVYTGELEDAYIEYLYKAI